jgi:hypothetical protein
MIPYMQVGSNMDLYDIDSRKEEIENNDNG